MLVLFDQIHYVLNFACIWLNNYSIDFDQTSVKSRALYSLKKVEKSYGAQISGTEVSINYTFNIFLKNLRCVI